MFLYNRRHHPEVILLLATTVLILSTFRCQTNLFDNFFVRRRLAGSAYARRRRRQNPPGGDTHAKIKGPVGWLQRTRCSGNVSDWRTSFQLTIFVIQTIIFYCETRITHTISFWLQKLSLLYAIFFSPKKA